MNRYDKINLILKNGQELLSKEDIKIVRGAENNKLTAEGWERFNELYKKYVYKFKDIK